MVQPRLTAKDGPVKKRLREPARAAAQATAVFL
jgi:hypothetical protein